MALKILQNFLQPNYIGRIASFQQLSQSVDIEHLNVEDIVYLETVLALLLECASFDDI